MKKAIALIMSSCIFLALFSGTVMASNENDPSSNTENIQQSNDVTAPKTTFTIAYMNGDELVLSQSCEIGDTVCVSNVDLLKEGFDLIGWSKEPEAVIPQYASGDVIAYDNEDVVLYAVWKNKTLIGDIDSDGVVSLSDLLIMIRYINDSNAVLTEDQIKIMDVYKDTYFNIKDVLKMTQYLAGWSNVILGE